MLYKRLNVLSGDVAKTTVIVLQHSEEEPHCCPTAPDFLYFMRTGGADMNHMSHIDQVLFQMYMKSRMRTYQAFFHVNPDYAYWYGWAMMTKDLGKIKELAETMRATHKN
jgi:hypothetical protein